MRSLLSWNVLVVSDTGTWHLAPLTNTLGSDLMGPSCTSVNLSCLRELQFQVFRLYCKHLQTANRISFFHQIRSFNVGFATSCEDLAASYKSVPFQVGTSKRRSARLQRGAQGYFFGLQHVRDAVWWAASIGALRTFRRVHFFYHTCKS